MAFYWNFIDRQPPGQYSIMKSQKITGNYWNLQHERRVHMENNVHTPNEPGSTIKPVWVKRVEFEREQIMADVLGYPCVIPNCACNNVTLYFFEANGKFDTKLFEIVLNHKTWQLESTESYKNSVDHKELVEEFLASLNDKIKTEILSGIKEEHQEEQQEEHVLRDDIDLSKYDIDTRVCYSDVFCVEPSEVLLFEFGKKDHFVIDYYCPKPECDCNEVFLAFHTLENNTVSDDPIMVYIVEFKTGNEYIHDDSVDVSIQLAKDLYEKLSQRLGGQPSKFFEERYQRIRKWSNESADALNLERDS